MQNHPQKRGRHVSLLSQGIEKISCQLLYIAVVVVRVKTPSPCTHPQTLSLYMSFKPRGLWVISDCMETTPPRTPRKRSIWQGKDESTREHREKRKGVWFSNTHISFKIYTENVEFNAFHLRRGCSLRI